ncbi:MAG TPA: MBL fold metallo-hydrolase, partial [Methanospirillum sp.]|nr:MBL fold metallo-hydrolase [Methanospirillum sp.]
MLVKNLTGQSEYYTSNVWHVCGIYYSLSDIVTLIDVGRDPTIIGPLETTKCGLGKRPVEQVILTHSHFDHAGLLPRIRERFHPKVYAHPRSRSDGIIPLSDRQEIQIGEQTCMAVHTPGHSDDSICILCEEEHLLFSGDAPMRIYSNDGEFPS